MKHDLNSLPTARVKHKGTEKELPLEEIIVGDETVVRPRRGGR